MSEGIRLHMSTDDGSSWTVDMTDIDGVEWREIKKATGLTTRQALRGLDEMDFETFAALLWVWRRRDEPELDYETVLKSLNMNSLLRSDDDHEGLSAEELAAKAADEEDAVPSASGAS